MISVIVIFFLIGSTAACCSNCGNRPDAHLEGAGSAQEKDGDMQEIVCSKGWRKESGCQPMERMIECVCLGRSMAEICGYTGIQNMPCYKLKRVSLCINKAGWDKSIKDNKGCSRENIGQNYGNVSSSLQRNVVYGLRKLMDKGGCQEEAIGFQDTLSSFLAWVMGTMEGATTKVVQRKALECRGKQGNAKYFDVKG